MMQIEHPNHNKEKRIILTNKIVAKIAKKSFELWIDDLPDNLTILVDEEEMEAREKILSYLEFAQPTQQGQLTVEETNILF